MTTLNETQKSEFLKKSEVVQQAAWDMRHKSELAYENGDFKACMIFDDAYCRLQADANYYHKLSYAA